MKLEAYIVNAFTEEIACGNPAGVDEDPVTGSVHTVLANYWGRQLNKKTMTAYQNSQRPGELILSIKDGNKVEIKGKARIFIKGHIEV